MQEQVPKTIHMIWFGYTPNYVHFAINAYKNINKNYVLNFVHYTPEKLEELYFNKNIKTQNDQLVFNVIDMILNKTYTCKYSELIQQQNSFLQSFGNIPFIQLLADIVRLELLNTFGGIYVDCDTYPIRNFDMLLNYENFCAYDTVFNLNEYNNYFLGSNGKNFISNYFDSKIIKLQQTNNFMLRLQNKKPLDFKIRRIKFFNCKLTPNDFNDNVNYIEHYSDFSWGRHKVSFTRFDDIFKK